MRLVLCICLFGLISCVLARIADPYKVLGVSRDATTKEIKKAYKQLAKEWHPDKNTSPDASAKFIQIADAHKLLHDHRRRKMYDLTGQTDEQPPRRHDPMFRQFYSFYDRMDEYHERINFLHEQRVNLLTYQTVVTPNSQHQPYVALFYGDHCNACLAAVPIWRQLTEELTHVNFGVITVHANEQPELVRLLGTSELPHLVMVLDGRAYHYSRPRLSMALALEFVKGKFPANLVQWVDDSTLEAFLGGWDDNRVRVLIFGRMDVVRLRYTTLAYHYRDRAAIGYVQLGSGAAERVARRYGVVRDTLLLFREAVDVPAVRVSGPELAYSAMSSALDSHRYLTLPRLSCQAVLEGVCPVAQLCAVLITPDARADTPQLAALRRYVSSSTAQRLAYAYVSLDRQTRFVSALVAVSADIPTAAGRLVLLQRPTATRLKFTWLTEPWEGGDTWESFNVSRDALTRTLGSFLSRNPLQLPYETEIQELIDEHAKGIFWRVVGRVMQYPERVWHNVTEDHVYVALSSIGSLVVIIAFCFFLHHNAKKEEERLIAEGVDLSAFKGAKTKEKELPIHELRGETYNGMIRLLKPGCRTIVLLCDTETKPKLITQFYKSCWPYRRNKTLLFGFLDVSRPSAMEWYSRLLQLGLPEPRQLTINPKNVVGSVIALNGHKRYYCLFHAKHPEQNKRVCDLEFESDESSNSDVEVGGKGGGDPEKPLLGYYDSVLFEDQLLDGFSNWLDRLFDGVTRRLTIGYWPDWPGK